MMPKSIYCPCCEVERTPKQGMCPECGWALSKSELVLGSFSKSLKADQQRELEECRKRRRKKLLEKKTVIDSTGVQPKSTIVQPTPSAPPLEWRAHENNKAVRSLSIRPNDDVIASGGMDNAVRVWRIGNKKEERTIRERSYPVLAVAFDPSGLILASGDSDGMIMISKPFSDQWRSNIKTLSVGNHHQVHSVAFSPDGTRFTCGDDRGKIYIWDTRTWTSELEFETNLSVIHSLGFCPGNTAKLFAAGSNGSIRFWDLPIYQRRLNHTPMNHATGPVLSMVFSPGGGLLFSGGADKSVRVWQTSNGESISSVSHSETVQAVAISSNGMRLAAGGANGTVTIWSLDPFSKLNSFKSDSSVNALAFIDRQRLLVAGCQDGYIRGWMVP